MSPSESTPDRRQRLHELVVALIAQQSDLELLDDDNTGSLAAAKGNPAGWLERNRRVVQRYQALVRSAATWMPWWSRKPTSKPVPSNSDKLSALLTAPWRALACPP